MLKNKVAVITGGTRGIGFAVVRKFLQNGAKVVLLGSRQESVDKAITELKKDRLEAIGFCPNLTNEKELYDCFKKVLDVYGRIDILINNAGIASSTQLLDYTEEKERNIIELNFIGVYKACKTVVPFMTNGGVIIRSKYGMPLSSNEIRSERLDKVFVS